MGLAVFAGIALAELHEPSTFGVHIVERGDLFEFTLGSDAMSKLDVLASAGLSLHFVELKLAVELAW